MTSQAPDITDLESLVGTVIPEGTFVIDAESHRRLVGAIHAADYDHAVAHPIFAHLTPHCGMGWSTHDLFELVGASLDSGVLFGEGHLTYRKPLLIGHTYRIRGTIAEVARKHGDRAGTFDLVTVRLEAIDDDDEVVVVSRETYVFPRGEPDAR